MTAPLLLALVAQASATQASAPPAAPVPPRFSILVDPCARERSRPGTDVVVCGGAATDSPRLPLPAERGPPDRPMASNPNLTGAGALAVSSTPCAVRIGGCDVGVNVLGAATRAVRLVQKLVAPDSCCEAPGEATDAGKLAGDVVRGVKRAFARKPDKSNRVPIPLEDPPAS